ncbi:MAG: hypothetical protein ABWZ88_09715 [Variovorax sp.]
MTLVPLPSADNYLWMLQQGPDAIAGLQLAAILVRRDVTHDADTGIDAEYTLSNLRAARATEPGDAGWTPSLAQCPTQRALDTRASAAGRPRKNNP